VEKQIKFAEVFRQLYAGNNCHFAAGHVYGHEVDTIYLEWTKDGDDVHRLLLRPDEASIIIHALSGALWSAQVMELQEKEEPPK